MAKRARHIATRGALSIQGLLSRQPASFSGYAGAEGGGGARHRSQIGTLCVVELRMTFH